MTGMSIEDVELLIECSMLSKAYVNRLYKVIKVIELGDMEPEDRTVEIRHNCRTLMVFFPARAIDGWRE